MIRINLLAEGRPKVSKPKKAATGAGLTSEPANLWLVVGLVVGLLLIAGQYFRLQSTINSKRTEIAEVQREVDELADVIAEVEQFEARKAELEHKIDVINTLKANQSGPVSVMDHISRSLPDMLWLTRMVSRGNAVTLTGQAFNTNAVANFIDNLDQVDGFSEPVLRDTSQRRGSTNSSNQSYSFSVNFSYDPAAFRADQEPPASTEAAG
jgi:type IV pilus assembly protein PilN